MDLGNASQNYVLHKNLIAVNLQHFGGEKLRNQPVRRSERQEQGPGRSK